jgi:tRNA(fMet)-specific endonuclease VapC
LCISEITRAELFYGVKSAASARTIRPSVEDFVRRLNVLDWDSTAAGRYADIRVKQETGGTPIGNMDILIAAHARSVSAVMVTNNEKHFRRVSGLIVENWA